MIRVCAKCGKKRKLITHHINGDHLDNRDGNHMTLCNSCHTRLHHTNRNMKYNKDKTKKLYIDDARQVFNKIQGDYNLPPMYDRTISMLYMYFCKRISPTDIARKWGISTTRFFQVIQKPVHRMRVMNFRLRPLTNNNNFDTMN